jgi:hypothetical protein
MRDRRVVTAAGPTLRRRRFVGPVLVWALLLGTFPRFGEPAPFPPGASPDAPAEAPLVAARLVALGVDPSEAAARLRALSADELRELAARIGEIETGGNPAAAALAIAIVAGLLVVLVLELLGRRVVSRPVE